MARGWIAGLLTGVVVAGLGLATASLVMGPVAPLPEAVTTALAPEPEAPEADAAPETEAVTEAVPAPQDETTQTPEPAAEEVTEAEVQTVPAPEPPALEPKVLAEPDPVAADQAPTPLDAAPMPVKPEDLQDPADPAPEADTPAAMPVPEPTAGAADTVQAAAERAPARPLPDEPAVERQVPVVEPVTAEQAPAEAEPVEPAPAEAEVDVMPPSPPVPDRSALPRIVVEAAPVPEVLAKTVLASPEADLPPELEADPAAAIITDRLPRIGAAPDEVPAAASREPALSRNALAFAPSGDQPRLAFLLIDTGPDDRASRGDLGNLPFPVTVAIDASATDAEQALAFYRAQGAEVVLTVPLPEAATPTDVDITVEAYAGLLDKAVAVLAEESLGFQTLGPGAVQLATNLAESGHGLVSFPAGLNTGHKAALKAGVKAGLVFRDLDVDGQGGAVIRRFLDNAAFKARGQGGVIVVARTRSETLQALLEWSLGTRAQSVALVPVSAVLSRE